MAEEKEKKDNSGEEEEHECPECPLRVLQHGWLLLLIWQPVDGLFCSNPLIRRI